MDLKQHLLRQMAWSHANFGPGTRTLGVLDHIRKECAEVEQSGGSAAEWVDVVILALDGLTRQLAFCNGERRDPHQVVGEACQMIVGKQSRNEARAWPDWRQMPSDKAIEHDRSVDAHFKEGDIVRYGDGPTAICQLIAPHAGGWHGTQFFGGIVFVTQMQRASEEECQQFRDERAKR
jgi:hypothetical protein